MRKTGMGLSTALLLAWGPLTAQEPGELFSRLDANRDGFVTADEVPENNRGLFERLVRNADKDGDKKLSKEEFQTGLAPDDAPRPPLAGGPGPGGRGGPMRPDRQMLEALFDRTDSNSDGKLTKDEIPEERQGMRMILERAGEALTKEQFIRGMLAMAPADGQAPRPEGSPPRRPNGPPGFPPNGPPGGRPDGPPGMGPGGGLFGTLDTDRDGQLSNAEIVAAGSALLKLDKNGDGKLTPDEAFGPGGPPGRPGDGRPEGRPRSGRGNFGLEALRDRWRESDANKDGKISKEEAPPMLKERFERADANSDGFLDEAEMRQMFERLRDGGQRRGGDQPRPGKAGDQ